MKKLIQFFLLALFIQSCEDEVKNDKTKFVSFETKNETTMNATIRLFRRNNDLFKEIIINSGDSSIVDEGYDTPPYTPTFSLTVSIDSAVILFSDNKKLIQTIENRGNNDNINNILRRDFYVNVNNKLRFTLKQSDYLRAQ
jgi:hypothetical protein